MPEKRVSFVLDTDKLPSPRKLIKRIASLLPVRVEIVDNRPAEEAASK